MFPRLAGHSALSPSRPTADETEAPSVKASNTTTQLIDIPTANPVSTILNEDGTVSIQIINGAASDLNNPIANLKVTGFSQPTYGEVSMGPSGNLIYDPEAGPDPLDYETKGVLTGDQVTFDYTVTNALGGTNSNTVTVTQTPVADTPTVNDSVITPLSTDPATLTRLRVTATSGDHGTVTDGSDYIQSLKLSGVPTNVTLSVPTAGFTLSGPTPDGTTDDYTVTTSGNPGTVAPEIDVSAPTLTSTNFNLGITAVNAETESPTTTASASTSQNIHVEHSTFTQQVAFSATNQSIWGSGDAPTVSFDKFLGIDTHAAGQTTIGSGPTSIFGSLASNNLKLGGSITLKAGFQADLMLNSGSFNATVPFNITLGDTYNEINKTLQVDPTDAQAPGGMIATTGPGGSFGLDFIFDAMASLTAGAHILGFGGTTTAHIGPFDATVPLLHYNTSTSPVSLSFSIEGINISFAWPTINTSGTGPNTVGAQTISASGTSNNFFSLGVDPIALGFDALGIPDPFNFEFGPIGLSLLAANIGVGVSFGQTFDLNGSLPSATLTPQGGTPQTLNFNRGPLILDNAPNQFSLSLTPDATLENNTSLVPTFNAGISALSASVGALSIGPLFSVSTSVPLAHFSFFNSTFPVAFGSQTVSNITV